MERGKHTNIAFDVALFLLGVILIIYCWIFDSNFLTAYYVLMGIYGVIKLSQFIIQKSKKDRENLYTSIACLITILIQLYKFPNDKMLLTFSLLAWISMMSIIKLIKLDYLHDRSLPMFKVRVVGFLLFVLLGIITNYTLLFKANSNYEIISYFLIMNGMIYISEGLIREYDFKLSEPKKNKKPSKKIRNKKA